MPTIDDDIRRSVQDAVDRIRSERNIEEQLTIVQQRGARSRSLRYSRNAALGLAAIALVALLLPRVLRELGRNDSVPATPVPPRAIIGTYQVQLPATDDRAQAAGTAGTWTITFNDGHMTLIPPSSFASSPVYADYTVSGDRFSTTAFLGGQCRGTGKYTWERTTSGLRFHVLDDPCPVRTTILSGNVMSREPTELDGRWRTDQIANSVQVEAITSAGYPQRFADAFLRDQGEPSTIRYSIEFRDGLYSTLASVDGSAPKGIDTGAFDVQAGQLELRPFAGGVSTFRYALTEDRLTLDLIDDTQPDYAGTPNEVFLRGIYLVAPFTKIGSS